MPSKTELNLPKPTCETDHFRKEMKGISGPGSRGRNLFLKIEICAAWAAALALPGTGFAARMSAAHLPRPTMGDRGDWLRGLDTGPPDDPLTTHGGQTPVVSQHARSPQRSMSPHGAVRNGYVGECMAEAQNQAGGRKKTLKHRNTETGGNYMQYIGLFGAFSCMAHMYM